MRERGIVLHGRPPAELIDPITPRDLKQAILDMLRWWEGQLAEPTEVQQDGYRCYTVQTMCRILYTMETGEIVLKAAASRWALTRHPARHQSHFMVCLALFEMDRLVDRRKRMGKLIYSLSASLDGFIEDEAGTLDWAAPDAEVHWYVNDQQRQVGTYLFGRRMYETMAPWDTDPGLAASSAFAADYAQIWRGIDKVVYSSTLESVVTPRTRIERQFDPEAVRQLVESLARDVEIAGPDLATYAFRAGLMDEVNIYVVPVMIGGGKPSLPRGVFLPLELIDEHRFACGVVHLRYRTRR